MDAVLPLTITQIIRISFERLRFGCEKNRETKSSAAGRDQVPACTRMPVSRCMDLLPHVTHPHHVFLYSRQQVYPPVGVMVENFKRRDVDMKVREEGAFRGKAGLPVVVYSRIFFYMFFSSLRTYPSC